jgi:uncharacterized membrane protein
VEGMAKYCKKITVIFTVFFAGSPVASLLP